MQGIKEAGEGERGRGSFCCFCQHTPKNLKEIKNQKNQQQNESPRTLTYTILHTQLHCLFVVVVATPKKRENNLAKNNPKKNRKKYQPPRPKMKMHTTKKTTENEVNLCFLQPV